MKNTIGRCVTYPEQNTTKKLISYHQITDSLALTQASVNQLPGSSDVNNRAVSVGSSVSDNCRKFFTLTRLEKFIHKSQNEEGQDMSSKANAKIKLF